MPIVSYPGVPLSDTAEEFFRKVTDVVPPAVVHALIPRTEPRSSERRPSPTNPSTTLRAPDRRRRTLEGQPRRAKMPKV